MRINRRGLSAAMAASLGLVPLSLAFASPASAEPTTDIKVNEIITNSPTVNDSIELTNIGTEPVDVSGWILRDNNDAAAHVIPNATVIAPGGFLAVATSFGLGNGDAARVFLPDGTTLVDGHTFASHSAPSWSRCPDGTGPFVQAVSETLGAANDCASVDHLVINEVESNGDPAGDWIELANPTGLDLDASGLIVKDNDDNRALPVPGGTVVPAGGYAAVFTEPAGDPAGFGLGGADSARIFTADGVSEIDSYVWTTHAATTYGRCPDKIGSFVLTAASTRAAANDCPLPAGAGDVKVNEIITNSNTVADSIELVNIGATPVDISGWILRDNNDAAAHPIPGGTTLPAGGFLAVVTSFGLGNGDAARLFLPDGVTQVDGHTFPSHSAPSWSRCPDGTGAFVQGQAETLGGPNACTTPDTAIKINEVESNGDATDWVELLNTGTGPVDLSGWVIKDDDDTHALTVPAETVLAPGGYAAFDTDADPTGFGLGGADSARVYAADGATLIDSYTWTSHATTSYGRCPDGVGAFTTTEVPTRAAANDCPVPSGADDLVINEVKTNPNPDFVELRNVSDHLVDVAGLKVADSNHAPVVITTESTPLQPGELFVFAPDGIAGGFGLGAADAVTIYLSDGVTAVDSYSWSSHRIPSYGLCPDAEGMVENAVASPGAENVCQPVRINEIESSGGEPGDWVELINVSDAPVDVSGWVVKDDDDTHGYPLPAATTLAAGDHLVVEEADLTFGLGGADSARLFRADGTTLVDSHTWTTHATTTYGRCPDGAGDFVVTKSVTKGAANLCPPPFFGVETEPWPGSQEITESDPVNAFVSAVSTGDVSGLAFDPNEAGVLWAIKNKNRLFKLTKVDGLWTPVTTGGWATGKELRFANGSGEPDTEGVTVGPDGAIYATSERDNTSSNVPRQAVLRYDPTDAGTTLIATHEWNLDADFPELFDIPGGSNLGFEGLTWVPDDYLVAGGFVDESTGAAYDPADYPGHGDGLFFLALENDGSLYAYALGAGTSDRVAVVPSGFPHAMDVEFDPERERIWAVCDDTCQGQVSLLKIGDDGNFAVDTGYDRPTGMPNLNNEGFAVAPQSTCVDGLKEVVWADDSGTGGHSLRSATLPCTPVAEQEEPTVTGTDAAMVYGKATTVDVTVTAEGVTPTGEVALTSGAVELATADLAGDGTATITLPARILKPRATPYPLTIAYGGDPSVAPGTGSAELMVRKGRVRLSATVKPARAVVKKTRAKAVVKVVNADRVPATGKVRITAKGIKAVTAKVVKGKATLKLGVFKKVGKKKLTIRYGGSALLDPARTKAFLKVVRR